MSFNLHDVKDTYEDIPAGTYTVLIEKAETLQTRQNSTQVKLQLRILDTKFAKRVVYDSCVPAKTTYWKIKEWLTAVNSDLIDKELTEELVAGAMRGKTVSVQIEPNTYEGKTTYKVSSYKSAATSAGSEVKSTTKTVFGV